MQSMRGLRPTIRAGALALWTHNLKNIDVLDYERPYYFGKALRFSAGIQLSEAYQAAHDQGLVVMGGTRPTVGLAGGYTQGTGHGLSVSKLRFSANQALEWEVVTVDGDILVATPEENIDLFWALSGGGGGTYGIVLSLTIKAYPDQRTAAANLTWTNEDISQETYYAMIQRYIAALPKLLDAGGTSIWLNSNDFFQMSPAVAMAYYSADFPTYLVNPVFRDASASLVVGTSDQAQNLASKELMTETLVPILSELIPGVGYAYLNEGDPWEPNWQQVFYGDSYWRLLEIKEKFDPDRVLYGRTSVGSEAWTEAPDGRLCQS
ncbi:hypothetical protein DL770_009636 [Monosporascus sp. CRB-9-2]|nr:hypothetical protein DL770_009636 [Monosporascus sp. CRB-9-2]